VYFKLAASLAAKMGYSNVQVFPGGIPEWVKEGYPLVTEKALPKIDIPSLNPAQLKGIMDQVLLLDIRNEALYEMGFIKGSVKIPIDLLSSRYKEIPKDKKIVVIDHAGNQVLVSARFLKGKGYQDVSRLQGGVIAWMNQGFPLEK
jgi:rhodanese-related sulfurtransferase